MFMFTFIILTLYSQSLFDIYTENISLNSFAVSIEKDENNKLCIQDIKIKDLYEL